MRVCLRLRALTPNPRVMPILSLCEATHWICPSLAVCFGAFGHVLPQDEPRLIRQIAGALKLGGRFVFVTSEMPPKWSKVYWFNRAFNAVMHLRNWLLKPPFIMYYLTFLLPEVQTLLEDAGFTVEVHQPFEKPLERLRLVIATRESH